MTPAPYQMWSQEKPKVKASPGRPVEDERLESFVSVAHSFENNDDVQTTMIDLVESMKDYILTSMDSKKTHIVRE